MPARSVLTGTCHAILLIGILPSAYSQEINSGHAAAGIPDVVYVNPEQFLPETLRQITRGEDRTLPLDELSQMLRDDYGVHILIEQQQLEMEGVRLDDNSSWFGGVPLYVALDQFCGNVNGVPLGWHLDGDVLVITTTVIEEMASARAFDASPFRDVGVSPAAVSKLLEDAVLNTSGYDSTASLVGNVIHAHGSFSGLQHAEAALVALRTAGRTRYFDQTELNAPLRAALSHRVQLPEGTYALFQIVGELERLLNVEIWIDERNLSDVGISADQGVSVPGVALLPDRLVSNIAGVELAFVPKNGRLWLTTVELAEDQYETVIYDIADLLSDRVDAEDIVNAILNGTTQPWFEGPGGRITKFAPLKCLVITHSERTQREIQAILADQRRLMRIDIPAEEDLSEVQVRGYQLKLETAEDVMDLIPELIAPGTWRTNDHPDRTGWMHIVSMGFQRSYGGTGGGTGFYSFADEAGDSADRKSRNLTPPEERFAVLVIRQTRGVQEQIRDWLATLHSTGDQDSGTLIPTIDLSVD